MLPRAKKKFFPSNFKRHGFRQQVTILVIQKKNNKTITALSRHIQVDFIKDLISGRKLEMEG